jgi:cytochrome b6-f complex subunit 4
MRPAANPFATPFEILPDWYLFGTFNLLRILSDKFMGILSILVLGFGHRVFY